MGSNLCEIRFFQTKLKNEEKKPVFMLLGKKKKTTRKSEMLFPMVATRVTETS